MQTRHMCKAQAAEIYTLLDREPGLRSRPPSAFRKLETWTSAKQLTLLEKNNKKKKKKKKPHELCVVLGNVCFPSKFFETWFLV